MITRLPAGSPIPVPFGNVSAPCPGAHTLRNGVVRSCANDAPGRDGAPKHVHPVPPVAALSRVAVAASDGGTSERTAWWTSGLPGLNWLEMTNESRVTWGLRREQW